MQFVILSVSTQKWKSVHYILPKILTLYIAYFIVVNRDSSQLQPISRTLHKLTLHRENFP